MSIQRVHKRRRVGINFVSDVFSVTVSAIATPSSAIAIPDEATHICFIGQQSTHIIKFGTSASMDAPASNVDGWRIAAASNTPRLLPLDPSTTHFRVRADADSAANRLMYTFLSLEPGTVVVI